MSLPGAPPPGSVPPPRRPAAPSGPVSHLSTPGFAGYNVAWSPFYPDRLAVAGSANYGLVGNGRLHLVGVNGAPGSPDLPQMNVQKVFDTQDGLYDAAWSEVHENQLAVASGDGSIKLYDVTLDAHPIRNWHEHAREVFSVDWNNLKKDLFASSSWDASVKVWHPEQPRSLGTITAHTACVYAALWSPHQPDVLATACGDGHLRVFDLRQPHAGAGAGADPSAAASMLPPAGVAGAGPQPVATVPVGGEVLSLDWNKYRPWHIATGSTDKTVKVWDLRSVGSGAGVGQQPQPQPPPGAPYGQQGFGQGQITSICTGHDYAVRRVAYSPHSPSLLASASYDMSVRIWDTDSPLASLPHVASRVATPHAHTHANTQAGAGSATVKVHDAHTEFVVGLGWSLFHPGLVASTAWDMSVHLWKGEPAQRFGIAR